MSTHYYFERSPLRRQYDLHGRILQTSWKRGVGKFTLNVDLSDIAPHFGRVTCYLAAPLQRATAYVTVVGVLGLLVEYQKFVPVSPFYLIIASFGLSWPALLMLLRFHRPFEIEQFSSHAGIVVFDVIRVGKQAAEFDVYVAVLHKAARAAQKEKEPNQAPTAPSDRGSSLTSGE